MSICHIQQVHRIVNIEERVDSLFQKPPHDVASIVAQLRPHAAYVQDLAEQSAWYRHWMTIKMAAEIKKKPSVVRLKTQKCENVVVVVR